MDKNIINQIVEIARVLTRKKIQDFSNNELTDFFPKLANIRLILFHSQDPGFKMMDHFYLRMLEEFRKRKVVPPLINIAYDINGNIIIGIETIDTIFSLLSFDDMYKIVDTIATRFEQDLDEIHASKARAIIIEIAEKYV